MRGFRHSITAEHIRQNSNAVVENGQDFAFRLATDRAKSSRSKSRSSWTALLRSKSTSGAVAFRPFSRSVSMRNAAAKTLMSTTCIGTRLQSVISGNYAGASIQPLWCHESVERAEEETGSTHESVQAAVIGVELYLQYPRRLAQYRFIRSETSSRS